VTVRANRIVASGTDIAGPAKEELDLPDEMLLPPYVF